MRTPALDRRRAAGAEGADVGAGDKAPSGADQHHRPDRRIGVAAFDILDDALGHARRERVDRRVVDLDDADPVDILEMNQSAFRHFNLPSLIVIPAKAGIQIPQLPSQALDPRFRGGDGDKPSHRRLRA